MNRDQGVIEDGPKVEVLWWRGCPSAARAVDQLREAMAERRLDPDSIEVTEVRTEAAALERGFVGSPTIRIDGEDVQPPGSEEPVGLTCRLYRLRDGRASPTPDPEDLREALSRAITRRS